MKHWSLALLVMMSLLYFSDSALQSAVEAEKPLTEENTAESNPDVKKMLQRIEQLEQRVKELEQKPAFVPVPGTTLTAPPRILLSKPGTGLVVPTVPQQPAHPQNWKRKQINGVDFYIVPLGKAGQSTAR